MSLALNDILYLPDGTWRVAELADEPNQGLVLLEPVEPTRGCAIWVPVAWVEVLMPQTPIECSRCGSCERSVVCSKCGEER